MIRSGFQLRDFVHRVEREAFWRELNPGVAIDTTPIALRAANPGAPRGRAFDRAKFSREGLIELGAVLTGAEAEVIANAVEKVVDLGIPPTFVYVYDEPWLAIERMAERIRTATAHPYAPICDFWAFSIGPGQTSWRPHRDRRELAELGPGCFRVVNTWVAVTDARPPASALCYVPLSDDPAYPDRLTETGEVVGAAHRAAASAGEGLAWSSNLLHWGGASEMPAGARPRMSVTCSLLRQGERDPPFESIDLAAPLPLARRLDLIAFQLLQYEAMQPVDAAALEWARSLDTMRRLAMRR